MPTMYFSFRDEKGTTRQPKAWWKDEQKWIDGWMDGWVNKSND